MKKIFSLIMIMLLLFLTSCKEKNKNYEKYVGNWIAVFQECENMPFSFDEIKDDFLKLKKNGKTKIFFQGKMYKGKWYFRDNRIVFEINKEKYFPIVKNNTLTFRNFLNTKIKASYALYGTKEAQPELYMSKNAKKLLGTWNSFSEKDILGNTVPSEKRKKLTVKFFSDYTVSVCLNNQNFKKQKWYMSGKFGSLNDGDYDVSWEQNGEYLDVIILIDGEYYVFNCKKD